MATQIDHLNQAIGFKSGMVATNVSMGIVAIALALARGW